jgi:hypothetical protein
MTPDNLTVAKRFMGVRAAVFDRGLHKFITVQDRRCMASTRFTAGRPSMARVVPEHRWSFPYGGWSAQGRERRFNDVSVCKDCLRHPRHGGSIAS